MKPSQKAVVLNAVGLACVFGVAGYFIFAGNSNLEGLARGVSNAQTQQGPISINLAITSADHDLDYMIATDYTVDGQGVQLNGVISLRYNPTGSAVGTVVLDNSASSSIGSQTAEYTQLLTGQLTSTTNSVFYPYTDQQLFGPGNTQSVKVGDTWDYVSPYDATAPSEAFVITHRQTSELIDVVTAGLIQYWHVEWSRTIEYVVDPSYLTQVGFPISEVPEPRPHAFGEVIGVTLSNGESYVLESFSGFNWVGPSSINAIDSHPDTIFMTRCLDDNSLPTILSGVQSPGIFCT